ncbi:hypothetical protein OE88DRAFT_1649201 [Heliocybe sulcata]|uniref:MULE transposase domain-containing protein n=1 Tax=Heliocybe sulcata TaxID=5364 RepID=A0A5C3MLH2_9AGAM|nr:hypothetical protein OE88DRAFT_1649201 [Heliocybe sulcata]
MVGDLGGSLDVGMASLVPEGHDHARLDMVKPRKLYAKQCQVEVRKLPLSHSQLASIDKLYATGAIHSAQYDPDHLTTQASILEFMQAHGLDGQSRQQLEGRWHAQWGVSWDVGKEGDRHWRTLLQCACGYHTDARQQHDMKKCDPSGELDHADPKPWERRNPYDYTGCLAHIEITDRVSDGAVLCIVGYFQHNTECEAATMKRLPAVPLHPHVYEVALQQLQTGGSKAQGVDTTEDAQNNLDDWLNEKSPNFRPEIRDAVFYYASHADQGERLKVCISTKEMDRAAWEIAHQSLIMLDGMFGLCTSRLLLFVAMGVDQAGKGVPLALFLFSAPTGNKATHAGYNREILTELLTQWKDHLSRSSPSTMAFMPLIAITDTDTKERSALLDVWPGLWPLLLKAQEGDTWKLHTRSRLQNLESRLMESTEHAAALQLIEDECLNFNALARVGGSSGAHAAKAGLTLSSYELSSSYCGWLLASIIMQQLPK